MRALKVLVVVMGVLLVAGTVGLAVAIVHRFGGGGGPAAPVSLALPAGAEIRGIAGAEGRVAVWLREGAEERVIFLDARTGRPVAETRFAR